MSKSITPDDGIVVSKAWLEGDIRRLENKGANSSREEEKDFIQLHLLKHILQFRTQPLKPVLEDSWEDGFHAGLHNPEDITTRKKRFLNNPIEIK